MRYLMEQVGRRLREREWRTLWGEPLSPHSERGPERWWLERKYSPPGRLVLVEFHEPGSVVVSPPLQPEPNGRYHVVFPAAELRSNDSNFFRALEYFSDPLGWNGKHLRGDWEPLHYWAKLDWQPELGGEVFWAHWSDLSGMVRLVRHSLGDRKQRLLACALARRLSYVPVDADNCAAIESAEKYADRLCPRRVMKTACKHSDLAWLAYSNSPDAVQAATDHLGRESAGAKARACEVVRDLVMNPFRPVQLRHSWLRDNGGSARYLAEAIDSEGRFEDMPILADALEDAGCSVSAILDHCRAPMQHWRGCWALDLLLGRSQKS
jgi:hypothetical protein